MREKRGICSFCPKLVSRLQIKLSLSVFNLQIAAKLMEIFGIIIFWCTAINTCTKNEHMHRESNHWCHNMTCSRTDSSHWTFFSWEKRVLITPSNLREAVNRFAASIYCTWFNSDCKHKYTFNIRTFRAFCVFFPIPITTYLISSFCLEKRLLCRALVSSVCC